MKTVPVYYQDPYKKELECRVLAVEPKGAFQNILLDRTIFYPEGGGQPSDRGLLGEAKVEYVRLLNGEIIHQVRGELQKGQTVKAVLDWNWRYRYMRLHTAGHLLHDVLMTMVSDLVPLRASHGKKAFLEYQGELQGATQEEIEEKVNQTLNQDLPVVTQQVSYDDLVSQCPFVPPNLPKDKPLRTIKIGDFPPMPDGGVHVKTTKEIGKIWIANIVVNQGKTVIRYGVAQA